MNSAERRSVKLSAADANGSGNESANGKWKTTDAGGRRRPRGGPKRNAYTASATNCAVSEKSSSAKSKRFSNSNGRDSASNASDCNTRKPSWNG